LENRDLNIGMKGVGVLSIFYLSCGIDRDIMIFNLQSTVRTTTKTNKLKIKKSEQDQTQAFTNLCSLLKNVLELPPIICGYLLISYRKNALSLITISK
jgi:hypothetical protein